MFTVDPVTGAGSLHAGLTPIDLNVRGLAIAADGTAYGHRSNGDLYSIDLATGIGSVIGSSGVGVTGMAFAPDGTLYAWHTITGLNTVNLASGALTDVNMLNDGGGLIQALDFGSDGTLFGARDNFFTISVVTGTISQVNAGPSGFDEVYGIAAPEPTSVVLLAVGLLAALWLRRR